jgi:hypothetical protein
MCYPSLAEIDAAEAAGEALPLPDDFLRRTGYRLPTEAEWEHACRAGTTTPRPFGTKLTLLPHYAWTAENSQFHAHPVATTLPDRRGLFDMLGNVMEWCHDRYKVYPNADQELVEDSGTSDLPLKADDANVIRGGAFLYAPSTARSSQRFRATAKLRVNYMGFRIARSCPTQ